MIVSALFAAVPARADLCVIVDPLFAVIVRGVKGLPLRFVLTLSFNDPATSSG